MRLKWIELWEEVVDAGVVCRRCGISRPTLRKWLRRYQAQGIAGLESLSRRPNHTPTRKVTPELESKILGIQGEGLGARRIKNELLFVHDVNLSQTTIQRTLDRNATRLLHRRRPRHIHKRYSASLPGERMQMDTMKVGPGLYQYTLIDDYSRFVYADIYPSRSVKSTLAFFKHLEDAVVYPIVRLQTDNGSEFTAQAVTELMLQNCIKWRPIAPGKPYLNGKVERVQRTIRDEMYSKLDLKTADVAEALGLYLMRYNYRRIHGALSKTPAETLHDGIWSAPERYAVEQVFDEQRERQLMKARNLKRLRLLLK